jgi:hypothetical protein
MHEAVTIQHRVHRADRRQVGAGKLPPQLLPNLRRAPARILALQMDDDRLELRRQPIRLPVRPPAPVGEGLDAAVFVAVENLVAGLPGNPELGTQGRHLFALEQAATNRSRSSMM